MSLTQEEQRKLAIECGAKYIKPNMVYSAEFHFTPNYLAAYTAAVEARRNSDVAVRDQYVEELRARERELISKLAEQQAKLMKIHSIFHKEERFLVGLRDVQGVLDNLDAVELDLVLAKERERCAEWVSRNLMPAGEMADEIRSWK